MILIEGSETRMEGKQQTPLTVQGKKIARKTRPDKKQEERTKGVEKREDAPFIQNG